MWLVSSRRRFRSPHRRLPAVACRTVLLDTPGPALNAGKAMFLYGPPGNGKTVIAEGLGRTLGGDMYMPYAIDVDGQTITMFDPINHESLETDAGPSSVIAVAPRDGRMVRFRRQLVLVRGC